MRKRALFLLQNHTTPVSDTVATLEHGVPGAGAFSFAPLDVARSKFEIQYACHASRSSAPSITDSSHTKRDRPESPWIGASPGTPGSSLAAALGTQVVPELRKISREGPPHLHPAPMPRWSMAFPGLPLLS